MNGVGQKKSVFFGKIPEIVENKDVLSMRCEPRKWRRIEYRTKLGQGELVVAAQEILPDTAVLNLKLKGWYKIYLGLFDMRSETYSFVKLSDDKEYTPVRQSRKGSPKAWCPTEYMEEVYWKCAELTNQKILLMKPKTNFLTCSGLAWIRCEKMTKEEITGYIADYQKENKCVQMHIDMDSFFEDRTEDKVEHFAKLNMLTNTNMDFCSIEYCTTYDHEDEDSFIPLQREHMRMTSGNYTYDEILKQYVELAHKNDMKLFAAERISLANFSAPYSRPEWRNRFVAKHKEYYCENRDGSVLNVCSYAYEKVQDYAIKHMKRMVRMGYDGITLICHRGIQVGFEWPIIERFHLKYPDLNPRRLPSSDSRLHEIWCDVMTEFISRVRKELDEEFERHIDINVITEYGLKSAKTWGIDVERWAREGLIDIVTQADMEMYEDLTGCCDEDGLIDLDRFKKRLEDYPIIKRKYSTDVKKVCEHMVEYLNLERLYGVKVYHVLPWVHTLEPEEYMQAVKCMEDSGAKRFLSWNTNHMVWNLPEYHIVTHIGNQWKINAKLKEFYRVLSLDHSDISLFNANWRG